MDILKARQELMMGKTIYDMELNVVDYGRVSTDKDDQINSLENQINYFNDMISGVKKWKHVGSYTDEGISGTQVHKREQFLKMIEDARLGKIDLVVTKEVSRFARNTIDSINYTGLLLKYGVIVLFISDNINTIYPDSEFRLTLMASMAQDEVRKLSERVKFGIQRSLKDGKLGGGGLYGYYKKDCKLIINEEEKGAVEMLFTLYASGNYGFKSIGEKMAEEGYYTRKGKVFSETTLKKMLVNPRYKGYFTGNLTVVEDYKTHRKVKKPKEEHIVYKADPSVVPPIVTEELWDKANKIYVEKNKVWNKNVMNKEFFLENRTYTSKIFCKEHNTTFIRTANCKRKDNPVWQCNNYLRHGIKGCLTPILYEKHLDEIFTSVIEKFVENKDELLDNILKDYKNLLEESNELFDYESLTLKLEEQKKYKDRLIEMSLKNLIDDKEFTIQSNKINEQIKKLNEEIINVKLSNNTLSYDNIINSIKKEIQPKMNIKDNIGKYFNLFIDKVFVSKINNDRKHIKLEVIFDFNHKNEEIEIYYNLGKDNTNNDNLSNKTGKITNRDYNVRMMFATDLLKQKFLLERLNNTYDCGILETSVNVEMEPETPINLGQEYLLLTSDQPRVCRTWKKTWKRKIIQIYRQIWFWRKNWSRFKWRR